VPLSVFVDNKLAGMISLTGMDTETRRVTLDLPMIALNGCYMQFFFGESGLSIDRIALELTEDLTEEIRSHVARNS
jgi:hypothetical protein